MDEFTLSREDALIIQERLLSIKRNLVQCAKKHPQIDQDEGHNYAMRATNVLLNKMANMLEPAQE